MKQTKTWVVLVKIALVLGLGIVGVRQAKADSCTSDCDNEYFYCWESHGEDPNCVSCECACYYCDCYVACGVVDPVVCVNNGCP
jgi:hypothetical protein